MVIDKPSSFRYTHASVFSSETCWRTLSPRLNMMALWAFSIITTLSFFVRASSNFSDPFNASNKPYWTSRACIFKRHKLKLFTPVNFSISYFVDDIFFSTLTAPICCGIDAQENRVWLVFGSTRKPQSKGKREEIERQFKVVKN